jgi:hypothetical protein
MASQEKQPSPFAKGQAKTGAKQYKCRAVLYPGCHLRGLVCASSRRLDSRCKVNRVGESLIAENEVRMKSTALVPQPKFGSAASASFFALALLINSGIGAVHAQNEPILVPDAVDYQKLLPILPDPPQGWVADKAEGSTEDVGGFRITNVHRDYRKGEGDKAPTAAISILDSVANPDYVNATTAAWKNNSETDEGYGKSVTSDGNPGFEAFEKENKHATLWIMIANRYFVQIELQNQDPKELQVWVKRVDLKKLAAIK